MCWWPEVAAEELRSANERLKKLEAALLEIRAKARFEQAHPTELHMTCLSLIEKTAHEALGK